MRNTIKTLLVVLSILSTESKSMEVSMDLGLKECQCVCDTHSALKDPMEESNHYFPLFEAGNGENKRTCFRIHLHIDTPNHQMLELSKFFYVSFSFPTTHVYLKISPMAKQSIDNIAKGNLPEGIKIVKSIYDGEPEFRNSEGGYIGDVVRGLGFSQIKVLHEGISAIAFDEKLPSGMLLSSQSMGKGSIRISSPHSFVKEDL